MTDCQLLHAPHPPFTWCLSPKLAMGMEIDSVPHHLFLNWDSHIPSPCSMSHAFCVLFFFPFPFLLLINIQSVWLVFNVQCPFLLWMPSTPCEKQVTLPSCPPESRLGYPKLTASFVSLGTECYFRTAESHQENIVSGALEVILWRIFFFLIRACLTIVSWLGARYSFQSVKNWLEYLWMASDSL